MLSGGCTSAASHTQHTCAYHNGQVASALCNCVTSSTSLMHSSLSQQMSPDWTSHLLLINPPNGRTPRSTSTSSWTPTATALSDWTSSSQQPPLPSHPSTSSRVGGWVGPARVGTRQGLKENGDTGNAPAAVQRRAGTAPPARLAAQLAWHMCVHVRKAPFAQALHTPNPPTHPKDTKPSLPLFLIHTLPCAHARRHPGRESGDPRVPAPVRQGLLGAQRRCAAHRHLPLLRHRRLHAPPQAHLEYCKLAQSTAS